MGSAFARRFLEQGVTPLVYNRSAEPMTKLVQAGAVSAESVAEVAQRAAAVLTVLGTGIDVRSVYGGDEGLLQAAAAGTLLIDCSTVEPELPASLAARAAGRGLKFADAGVGGMPQDALDGAINFMYGSEVDDSMLVERTLGPLAGTMTRCGDPGAGMTMKIINNLLANAIHVADLEALTLADRAGLDRSIVIQTLLRTAAGNSYLRDRVPAELTDTRFVPGFKVDLAAKDARLGHSLAERLGMRPQVLFTGSYLLFEAQRQGLGDKSLSVLFRALGQQRQTDDPGTETWRLPGAVALHEPPISPCLRWSEDI